MHLTYDRFCSLRVKEVCSQRPPSRWWVGAVQGVQRVYLISHEGENYKPPTMLGHLGHQSLNPARKLSETPRLLTPLLASVFEAPKPNTMPCPPATSYRSRSSPRTIQSRLT